jgi:hypothetical protein
MSGVEFKGSAAAAAEDEDFDAILGAAADVLGMDIPIIYGYRMASLPYNTPYSELRNEVKRLFPEIATLPEQWAIYTVPEEPARADLPIIMLDEKLWSVSQKPKSLIVLSAKDYGRMLYQREIEKRQQAYYSNDVDFQYRDRVPGRPVISIPSGGHVATVAGVTQWAPKNEWILPEDIYKRMRKSYNPIGIERIESKYEVDARIRQQEAEFVAQQAAEREVEAAAAEAQAARAAAEAQAQAAIRARDDDVKLKLSTFDIQYNAFKESVNEYNPLDGIIEDADIILLPNIDEPEKIILKSMIVSGQDPISPQTLSSMIRDPGFQIRYLQVLKIITNLLNRADSVTYNDFLDDRLNLMARSILSVASSDATNAYPELLNGLCQVISNLGRFYYQYGFNTSDLVSADVKSLFGQMINPSDITAAAGADRTTKFRDLGCSARLGAGYFGPITISQLLGPPSDVFAL